MKESALSPTTRALLQAAKTDGPGAAARMKMWGAVSAGTGLAVASQAGTSAATSSAAAASSAKLVLGGALFGSALTVGIAIAIVRIVSGGSAPANARVDTTAAVEARQVVVDDRVPPESAKIEAQPIPIGFSTLGIPEGLSSGKAKSSKTTEGARSGSTSGARPVAEDSLWLEESLILEARGALRRGNPEAALASLDAAHRLGSHKLEPEELSVRAKTLRALGRDAEADEVYAALKSRYPDQAR